MNFKQKLAYMALGSLLTLLGFILATVVGEVTAQNMKPSAEFDELKCRSLQIVDALGKPVAVLEKKELFGGTYAVLQILNDSGVTVYKLGYNPNGGSSNVYHGTGETAITLGISDELSKEGYVQVTGKDGKGGSKLGIDKGGGFVSANGKDGKSSSILSISEWGGYVSTNGKDGKGNSILGVSRLGGFMIASGKDGKSSSVLGIDELGGMLSIANKGGQAVLRAGAEGMGGGMITTQDKHGYITGNLP